MTLPGISLDVHAHLIPIEAGKLLSQPGVIWDAAGETLQVDGHAIRLKSLFRPDELIAWMDTNAVCQSWISVPPPVYRQHLEATGAEAWATHLNEGLAAISASHPTRLEPLFHLPVEHPALAARMAGALGPAKFALCAGGKTSLRYSDPGMDPLWSVLDAQGAFVFLHPGACCDERLNSYYLENLLGNPHETAVTAAHLIFGGVCERFRGIRFCLAHGGGTVPMVAGRWQRGHGTGRPGVDTTMTPPRAVLRSFFADCLTHDAEATKLAAQVFGSEHLLFGSDWPFPMGLIDPHRQTADLPPLLRKTIFSSRPDSISGPSNDTNSSLGIAN